MLYYHARFAAPLSVALAALCLAPTARAEVPSVVADIPPIASLVAQVMGDLGTPTTLIKPGSSPHTHALRPSEAAALNQAALVVWASPDLTPWLEEAVESLDGSAHSLTLMTAKGAIHHPQRTPHHHHGEHDDEANHDGHADHEEHKQDHAAEHEEHHEHEHKEEHHAEHHQDHHEGGYDAHGWLDPRNGQLWLSVIAEELAALDPEHAGVYRANADAGRAGLAALESRLAEQLAPVTDRPFAVYHDAYQYFEKRFGLHAPEPIANSSGGASGPARIAQLREIIAAEGIHCAFSEPEFSDHMIDTVFEGTTFTRSQLDPLGHEQPPGPDLYAATLEAMANSIVSCLTAPGH